MKKINVFWFRRDLRLDDNHALSQAIAEDLDVLPIFIFDRDILDDLQDRSDARVSFIHGCIQGINLELSSKESGVKTFYGDVLKIFDHLTEQFSIQSVFANRDYEPYAIQRDNQVAHLLEQKGIAFKTFKDHVIFEQDEIVKDDGKPYLVYTPFSRKWLSSFTQEMAQPFPNANEANNWVKTDFNEIIPLEKMGFQKREMKIPEPNTKTSLIRDYENVRDIPAKNGTSKVGIHLRFGTISIRGLIRSTAEHSLIYFKELIWREFFITILYHFPHVVNNNFNSKYDGVPWRNNEKEFEMWCKGQTGFPIVDAGMRELNATGFMHNRVRMITASFLTKHLLIDWRWGEAYFAKKLLDFELASNNGNWQWAAGTGVDASPYFRVFNPTSQHKKFDPKNEYVHQWVQDVNELTYPSPMVDHKIARERAISTYKAALQQAN